jgi:hypothetical protein
MKNSIINKMNENEMISLRKDELIMAKTKRAPTNSQK